MHSDHPKGLKLPDLFRNRFAKKILLKRHLGCLDPRSTGCIFALEMFFRGSTGYVLKIAHSLFLLIACLVIWPVEVVAWTDVSTQTFFSPSLKLTLSEKTRIRNAIAKSKERLREFLFFFAPVHRVRLEVIFLSENEYHERYNAPVWSAALYRAERILIKYRKEEKLSNKELMKLISHELIHSIIAHGAGSSCSHSMDEGIAMIFEKLSSYSMDYLLREIANHAPEDYTSLGQPAVSFSNLFQRTNKVDIERSYDMATNEILILLSQSLQAKESAIVTLGQCLPNIRQLMNSLNISKDRWRRLEGVQTQSSPLLSSTHFTGSTVHMVPEASGFKR